MSRFRVGRGFPVTLQAGNYLADANEADTLFSSVSSISLRKVLVYDRFNRADSAVSLGSAETGQNWAVDGAGNWGISANQAYQASGSTAPAIIESGKSDGKVSVKLPSFTAFQRLLARYTDINNHYRVSQTGTGPYTYVVNKFQGGVSTIIASTAISPANGDIITFEMRGTALTLIINGIIVATVTDSFNVTATKYGFLCSNNVAKYDEFIVEA